MEVIGRTPRSGAAPQETGRTNRASRDRGEIRSSGRQLFVRLGVAVVGLAGFSTTACAHGLASGGVGHGENAVAVGVVLGLPTLAGLVGGVVAVRHRRIGSKATFERGAYVAVGFLLVCLGAASLLPVVAGRPWLSITGGTVGAVVALRVAGDGTTANIGCRTHADLALGAVATHRLFEGLVVGALYSAGAAVGVLAAVVIAGHAALETAGVGALYAPAPRRTGVMGAIVLVQAGYLVGAGAGLGVSGAVPPSLRTFVLAVVGGTLLVVGAGEVERSVTAG